MTQERITTLLLQLWHSLDGLLEGKAEGVLRAKEAWPFLEIFPSTGACRAAAILQSRQGRVLTELRLGPCDEDN